MPGERGSERGGRRGPCALHRGSGGVPSAPRAHRSSPRRRPPSPVPAPSPAPSRCSTPAPPSGLTCRHPPRPQPRPSRDWLRHCPPANGSSRRLGRHREPGRSRPRRLLRSESAGGSAGRGGKGEGPGAGEAQVLPWTIHPAGSSAQTPHGAARPAAPLLPNSRPKIPPHPNSAWDPPGPPQPAATSQPQSCPPSPMGGLGVKKTGDAVCGSHGAQEWGSTRVLLIQGKVLRTGKGFGGGGSLC